MLTQRHPTRTMAPAEPALLQKSFKHQKKSKPTSPGGVRLTIKRFFGSARRARVGLYSSET
jgi:hypothetical protein